MIVIEVWDTRQCVTQVPPMSTVLFLAVCNGLLNIFGSFSPLVASLPSCCNQYQP